MKRRVSIAGLTFILAAGLAGCGQKGPLYLPSEARDVVTRPATPAPDVTTTGETAPVDDKNPDEDEDKNGKPPR